MERCRSSEPALGNPFTPDRDRKAEASRGGRTRDVKATSLLFKSVPSAEQILSTEKAEWSHIESPRLSPDDKMDIDGEHAEGEVANSDEPVIWGMPKWGFENERGGEVRKGVRLVGMEEVSGSCDDLTEKYLAHITAPRAHRATQQHRYSESCSLPLVARYLR